MTHASEGLLVAKFGGTSMARPEIVAAQLGFEQNTTGIVVVSAPGSDDEYPVKATNMLLGYTERQFSADDLQHRFAAILAHNGMANDETSRAIISEIPTDLAAWSARGDPVEALGEYWSAKLFAAQSGRHFVDARELFFFNYDGTPNTEATFGAIQSRLGDGRKYVVPGFYGSFPDGGIGVFPRGGSDISGAIIAKALSARAYHNWSDVDGFMTADPRKVADARLLDMITYREARELGNGGSELLHRTVIKYLGGTGIKTVMRKTFGTPGNIGTQIVDDRAWQWQPIIGVTGRDDLIVLNLHEFGLNEGVGETLDIIEALKAAEVPYEHSIDATDDVSIYLSRRYRKKVDTIVHELRRPGRTMQTRNAGLVHIVGEGLAHSGSARLWALGRVSSAFFETAVEGMGVSDVGRSATQTYFVGPLIAERAVSLAHQALRLGHHA